MGFPFLFFFCSFVQLSKISLLRFLNSVNFINFTIEKQCWQNVFLKLGVYILLIFVYNNRKSSHFYFLTICYIFSLQRFMLIISPFDQTFHIRISFFITFVFQMVNGGCQFPFPNKEKTFKIYILFGKNIVIVYGTSSVCFERVSFFFVNSFFQTQISIFYYYFFCWNIFA